MGTNPLYKGRGCSSSRLGGVNIGFWSQCVLGKTPLYLAGKVSFRAVGKEICKINIFNPFYSLDSCNQSLKWSLFGSKKGGPRPE